MPEQADLPHLDAAAITAAVPMTRAIDAVAGALSELAAGGFEQPARLVLDQGRLLVMAATHLTSRAGVVKTVSVRIGEVDRTAAPAIRGTLLWLDGSTGDPLFTADGAQVTALRTGAVAGVATDLLADPEARSMGMLGAGRQAMTQILAVCAVRPIRRLVISNRTPAHAHALARRVRSALPDLDVWVEDDPQRAVAGADVVCCATGSRTPLFDTSALADNVHVNAVGSYRPRMTELPPNLLLTADVVTVDNLAGCLDESGEIAAAVAAGFDPSGLRPLGELISGRPDRVGHARNTGRTGRTVFKSVGCAVLDWAIAAVLAGEHGRPPEAAGLFGDGGEHASVH